jgi:hypothetical protein
MRFSNLFALLLIAFAATAQADSPEETGGACVVPGDRLQLYCFGSIESQAGAKTWISIPSSERIIATINGVEFKVEIRGKTVDLYTNDGSSVQMTTAPVPKEEFLDYVHTAQTQSGLAMLVCNSFCHGAQ